MASRLLAPPPREVGCDSPIFGQGDWGSSGSVARCPETFRCDRSRLKRSFLCWPLVTPLMPIARERREKGSRGRNSRGHGLAWFSGCWHLPFWPQVPWGLAKPSVLAGSYFARDAAYSHHYSKSNTKSHTMFLARVLVGEFVRGNTSFVRPPAKEGQGTVLYDSCVNSVSDPSIFVIFEKHQAYPEYVIQYTALTKPMPAASNLLSLASLFSGRQ